jgi:hypothetical protein
MIIRARATRQQSKCAYSLATASTLNTMESSKHGRNDENNSLTFTDRSNPVPKHPRLKALPLTLVEIKNIYSGSANTAMLFSTIFVRANQTLLFNGL